MADVVKFSGKNKSTTDAAMPSDPVVQVKVLHQRVLVAEGTALPLAMELGDLLRQRKEIARYGHWSPFLRMCGLSPRTDQVYRQLAAAREEIEAQMRRGAAPLSIAAALKLIQAGKPKPERRKPEVKTATTPAITVDAVLTWLSSQAPAEDKRRVVVALIRDTELMKSILPAKALPSKPTPAQVYNRAMGLLSPDEAGARTSPAAVGAGR